MGQSKVLVVGGTGFLGRYIVNASVKLGHPTFVLVRSATLSDPSKAELVKSWKEKGVTLLEGDLTDHSSLVAALKQVEVVVSVVNRYPIAEQVNILAAAKEAGTIKRFLPSEFGFDVEKVGLDIPVTKAVFDLKRKIRQAARESGIPYTFVAGFGFASYYLAPILQERFGLPPPRDGKLVIYGDGNSKVVFLDEEDIGTFTIKSIDDPRAENKTLIVRPKENVISQNDLTALWEKKIGHVFEKEFLSNEEILKSIPELPYPANFYRALTYHFLGRGELNVELDPSTDVEATALYPDVKYITVDEYLDRQAQPTSASN